MILLIDDEVDVLKNMEELLLPINTIIHTVSCSKAALALLQERNYSCIVTDISLPGVNGVELIKKIRAERPDAKIICISAYADLLEDDLKELKVDAIFNKPYSPAELINKINELG